MLSPIVFTSRFTRDDVKAKAVEKFTAFLEETRKNNYSLVSLNLAGCSLHQKNIEEILNLIIERSLHLRVKKIFITGNCVSYLYHLLGMFTNLEAIYYEVYQGLGSVQFNHLIPMLPKTAFWRYYKTGKMIREY